MVQAMFRFLVGVYDYVTNSAVGCEESQNRLTGVSLPASIHVQYLRVEEMKRAGIVCFSAVADGYDIQVTVISFSTVPIPRQNRAFSMNTGTFPQR